MSAIRYLILGFVFVNIAAGVVVEPLVGEWIGSAGQQSQAEIAETRAGLENPEDNISNSNDQTLFGVNIGVANELGKLFNVISPARELLNSAMPYDEVRVIIDMFFSGMWVLTTFASLKVIRGVEI